MLRVDAHKHGMSSATDVISSHLMEALSRKKGDATAMIEWRASSNTTCGNVVDLDTTISIRGHTCHMLLPLRIGSLLCFTDGEAFLYKAGITLRWQVWTRHWPQVLAVVSFVFACVPSLILACCRRTQTIPQPRT